MLEKVDVVPSVNWLMFPYQPYFDSILFLENGKSPFKMKKNYL